MKPGAAPECRRRPVFGGPQALQADVLVRDAAQTGPGGFDGSLHELRAGGGGMAPCDLSSV